MNAETQELAVAIGAAIAERISLPKYLTVEEVAEITQIHPESVRAFARSKRLKGFQIGTSWRFTAAQVREFVESEKQINPN